MCACSWLERLLASRAQSLPPSSPLLPLPHLLSSLLALRGVRLHRVGGSSGWIGRVCSYLHVPPGMPCAGPAVPGTAACRNSRQQASPKPSLSLSSPPFFEMFGRENRLPTHHFFAYPRFLFVHLGSWAFERVGALPSICRILCKTVI